MQTVASIVKVMQSHQGNHCALATQQHGRIGLKQAAAAVCCCVSSKKASKNLIQCKHHVTDVQGGTMSDCSAFACAFREHIPLPGSVFGFVCTQYCFTAALWLPISQHESMCYMLNLRC